MRKKIIIFIALVGFVTGLLLSGAVAVSVAAPPVASNYEAYPPFLSASVPPLVMLVMGRDHKLYFEAYNDASDLNEDGVLDTTYKPDAIDYYGYFDSYKYYSYSTANKRFEPAGVTTDKKAPSGSYWSGDFLNYLTMSRIDVLRKVLYGGYRSVDTATETVLERAYIPNDAHCWGKEYSDEVTDGYKISDYTPYAEPTAGTRHLFASGSIVAPGTAGYAPLLRVKLNSANRIWTWVSAESGDNILGDTLVGTPDADFSVRVQVGVAALPDVAREKKYGSGASAVYKPVGILQRNGETNRMYFGLITGSYGNHLSGGVLRKNISSISNEIDPDTGQFKYKTDTTVDGIIKTIDNFRVIGFDHSGHYWDYTTYAGPISEGQNYMWGNPVAEMMYESLRYFAGESKTTAFSSLVSDGNDRGLDLPLENWVDPYTVFPSCSKPIMLVLSDINPSYDTDQLPGSYFGGTGSFGTFDASAEADTISSGEGFSGTSEHYIGQNGTDTDSACSAKSITGLGEIRGLCPEEPTKMGGYYAASVAYYGIKSTPQVSTYSVALASPLPQIKIPMDGGHEVTLVPFAKTVYSTGGGGVEPDRGDFQPTCAIVDFYVDSITPTSGKFRVTYEHAEQGSDYDMDALITYEYTKTSGTTLDVKISSMEATYGGGSKQHFGYIISGTDADGVYLEIKNNTQLDGEDKDYYLDTPDTCGPNTGVADTCWDNNLHLPDEKTRSFTAGSVSAATLLEGPLYYAAKWGGFDDKNGNQIPDQQSEWDKDGDGVPDTYYYVVNPLKLETQLNESFATIQNKTSSGTTSSVLATNSEGEGHLLQAYFKPKVTTASGNDLTWLGYLQSLWVDPWGNLREDTNGNLKLDLTNSTLLQTERADADMIITYTTDASTGDTRVIRYHNHHLYHPSNGLTSTCTLGMLTPPVTCPDLTSAANFDTVPIDDIAPIFEAGKKLALRTPSYRKIFTFIDGNGVNDDATVNALIDESGEDEGSGKYVGQVLDPINDDPFVDGTTDEVIPFTDASLERLKPFLGLRDPTAWAYLDSSSSPSQENRVINLINFIRGVDSGGLSGSPGTRSRTLDDGNVWKLGDIVNSTPVSISKAPDYYHLIYGDESFQDYLDFTKNRETVVYVGANDGMLHAFTSWYYNASGQYTQPASTTEGIGDELWAYIPQTLLPHLKFLADPEYAHSYYVDLKPKLFDAQIFTSSTTHPGGWGTILLVGLNMGGKHIWAEDDFDGTAATIETRHFYPTYICMDVTDPRNPRLLWERSYEDLAMTSSFPAAVAVGKTRSLNSTTGKYSWSTGKWVVAFGSGPTDYDGTSDQNGYVYIVDLDTGIPNGFSDAFSENEWRFDTGEPNTLMNSPTAFDKNLTYNVDAIYFGSVSKVRAATATDNGLAGKVYKVNTHPDVVSTSTTPPFGVPLVDPASWTMSSMFDSPGPISASIALSTDKYNNVWAFFGTGRFQSNADKTDETQQYFFGVKDPYFNSAHQDTVAAYDYYLNVGNPLGLNITDLFDSSPYSVYTNRTVTGVAGIANWSDLLQEARQYDGWYYPLEKIANHPSERVISKATVLGGIVFFPGYTFNEDICGFGGDTNFYGTYYETGTAYYKHILPGTITTDATGEKVNSKYIVGHGAPPPAAGFHVGRESGATAFLQMSTGEVVEINVDTAFNIKSGIAAWRDKNK